jgi:hypothetical protein
MAQIYRDSIRIDAPYIEERSGILNALTTASAQYIYRVLEYHVGRENIKRFPSSNRLQRTIIHKNAHLDEYFAELIFRAILPPHLKDIEVSEHVLMSKEDDSYAKISWPNGVVFGIHADEAGGAKALAFYDEHHADGTRTKPSCSQLVAEQYIGSKIPKSIQKVLDEVNISDSHGGANQYNVKNLFSAMHDILFVVGKNEVNGEYITKYLTENWKRAIVDSCMTAMIYAYENNLIPDELKDDQKERIERVTRKSLDYFLQNTDLSKYSPEYFEKVSSTIKYHFTIWDEYARSREKNRNKWHQSLNGAIWKNEDTGEEIGKQILMLQPVCFALHKCWGDNIANFIMMHIWQILFHQQNSFQEIKNEILQITNSIGKGETKFGYIEKAIIEDVKFHAEQSKKDLRKRTLNLDSPLWVYSAIVADPKYPNVATVIKHIINNSYEEEGNNGFGLLILHDKTINSKIINNGQTIPGRVWQQLSDKVANIEPDCWFQLKNTEGKYADFILNRNKAHQEVLPSELIDNDFIINGVKQIS